MFRKTCETKLAMSISVEGERVEEEQNATLALLEARSREELAKTLLGIALQRSRASAGGVLFNENGQLVPFATSNWAENAVRGVRVSSSRFALDVGALEHVARMSDPISMNEVLSRFDGIELSVLWIPLRYQGDTVGLIYLEADRGGSFGATSIESFSAIAIQAAAVLANLRLADDRAREIRLKHAEASRDEIYDSMLRHQCIGKIGDFKFNPTTGASIGSRKFFRILGVSPEAEKIDLEIWIGKLHPDDRARVERETSIVVATGSTLQLEYRIIKDGRVRHVYSEGHPKTNGNGDLLYRGIVIDVTERKAAERLLAETQAELSNASRLAALGELAGSIVHEVNQPLTALITSAEACRCWLSRCPMEISETVEAANQFVNKGKRNVAIAGGLEVLAKGAQANLRFIRIDGVILEVLGMLRDELEKSSISVRADIDEGLPELRGDRLQLQQAVFNLLRNGIDAMKDVHGRARRLEISCRADNVEMLTAFRHCGGGSGTNTNDMNHLFDPFLTTRDSEMNLGIFISRRIIEAHRGRIWAERNEDCGLTIWLALPL
jgi:two-component system, LuxR family, sensor kinase FixL